MSLYTLLLLGSIVVPLLLSFDKKLHFYRQWKYLFSSISVVAIVYIGFDYWLTLQGVWAFNAIYHSSFIWFGLPLEEWLFFMMIPYASIFLHDSIVLYFQNIKLSNKLTLIISYFLIALFILLIVFQSEKTYTVYISIKMIVVLILACFDKSETFNRFYLTFLVIIIPFAIVNGILTGSFIEGQVVWYNDKENLGLRFFTIPAEDFAYAFSLIAYILLLRNKLMKFYNRAQKIR
jgi:lycopene cyclase domain-containing protein